MWIGTGWYLDLDRMQTGSRSDLDRMRFEAFWGKSRLQTFWAGSRLEMDVDEIQICGLESDPDQSWIGSISRHRSDPDWIQI